MNKKFVNMNVNNGNQLFFPHELKYIILIVNHKYI